MSRPIGRPKGSKNQVGHAAGGARMNSGPKRRESRNTSEVDDSDSEDVPSTSTSRATTGKFARVYMFPAT
jgi:hypothetical protein